MLQTLLVLGNLSLVVIRHKDLEALLVRELVAEDGRSRVNLSIQLVHVAQSEVKVCLEARLLNQITEFFS